MAEVKVFKNIMSKNERAAAENAEAMKKSLCVNMMSSPGAGKTTILEKTLAGAGKKLKAGIIEGDVATSKDAQRLKKYSRAVHQIKTENFGGACHLDASMVAGALKKLRQKAAGPLDLIIVENVGNLICPADFFLGEDKKVVILSATEGEEKPLKYPLMFRIADLLIVNKSDLFPHIDFSMKNLKKNAKKVNPKLKVLEMSAKTGAGVKTWAALLEKWAAAKKKGKRRKKTKRGS